MLAGEAGHRRADDTGTLKEAAVGTSATSGDTPVRCHQSQPQSGDICVRRKESFDTRSVSRRPWQARKIAKDAETTSGRSKGANVNPHGRSSQNDHSGRPSDKSERCHQPHYGHDLINSQQTHLTQTAPRHHSGNIPASMQKSKQTDWRSRPTQAPVGRHASAEVDSRPSLKTKSSSSSVRSGAGTDSNTNRHSTQLTEAAFCRDRHQSNRSSKSKSETLNHEKLSNVSSRLSAPPTVMGKHQKSDPKKGRAKDTELPKEDSSGPPGHHSSKSDVAKDYNKVRQTMEKGEKTQKTSNSIAGRAYSTPVMKRRVTVSDNIRADTADGKSRWSPERCTRAAARIFAISLNCTRIGLIRKSAYSGKCSSEGKGPLTDNPPEGSQQSDKKSESCDNSAVTVNSSRVAVTERAKGTTVKTENTQQKILFAKAGVSPNETEVSPSVPETAAVDVTVTPGAPPNQVKPDKEKNTDDSFESVMASFQRACSFDSDDEEKFKKDTSPRTPAETELELCKDLVCLKEPSHKEPHVVSTRLDCSPAKTGSASPRVIHPSYSEPTDPQRVSEGMSSEVMPSVDNVLKTKNFGGNRSDFSSAERIKSVNAADQCRPSEKHHIPVRRSFPETSMPFHRSNSGKKNKKKKQRQGRQSSNTSCVSDDSYLADVTNGPDRDSRTDRSRKPPAQNNNSQMVPGKVYNDRGEVNSVKKTAGHVRHTQNLSPHLMRLRQKWSPGGAKEAAVSSEGENHRSADESQKPADGSVKLNWGNMTHELDLNKSLSDWDKSVNSASEDEATWLSCHTSKAAVNSSASDWDRSLEEAAELETRSPRTENLTNNNLMEGAVECKAVSSNVYPSNSQTIMNQQLSDPNEEDHLMHCPLPPETQAVVDRLNKEFIKGNHLSTGSSFYGRPLRAFGWHPRPRLPHHDHRRTPPPGQYNDTISKLHIS